MHGLSGEVVIGQLVLLTSASDSSATRWKRQQILSQEFVH
jgi:hypothetical protein